MLTKEVKNGNVSLENCVFKILRSNIFNLSIKSEKLPFF